MNAKTAYKKIKQICLSFPDSVEMEKWGNPHFCVNKKIFAGCELDDARVVVGFKLEMGHAAAIIQRPGFSRAPYVGHKGWVSMDPTVVNDWPLIVELISESFQLIAPRRSLAKLDEQGPIKITNRSTSRKKTETTRKSKPVKKKAVSSKRTVKKKTAGTKKKVTKKKSSKRNSSRR